MQGIPMRSTRFLIPSLAILLAAASFAKVEIKTDLKDGQTISGEITTRVVVQSNNLVTSVEFYINDDLRLSDDSTPYEFRIDTIAEAEGPLKLKISAYTSEGESASKTFTLKVDNGIGKGADKLVEEGYEFLRDGKIDEAINAGRVALKAKAKFIPARLLLAKANFQKGIYDLAQKFTEEILAEQPNNVEALDLNAAIALERAFNTMNRGDRNQTVETIKTALKQAASSRAKVYDARLEALGQPTDANLLRVTDVMLQAGRFNRVVSLLQPKFQSDPTNASIANRYIFALLRTGKLNEANLALGVYLRRGKPDAAGHALAAVILQALGKNQEALDAEKLAITNDASDLTVRSGQVLLSLSRGNMQVMGQLVKDLVKDESSRFEVLLYQSSVFNAAGDFERARQAFEEAVLAEPTSYDAYVLRANQLVGYSINPNSSKEDVAFQRNLAKAYLEAALDARPESFEALTGLSILALFDNKTAEAIKLAEAATLAGPQYAGGYYVAALAANIEANNARVAAGEARQRASTARANRLLAEAEQLERQATQWERRSRELSVNSEKYLKAAKQSDAAGLEGRGLPSAFDAWRYFATRGRTPLLIQPQY